MKKSFIGILAATIILSGCGTSQMAVGDPNAVLAGAAIGSNVGGAIGGLIGDSNGGWRELPLPMQPQPPKSRRSTATG